MGICSCGLMYMRLDLINGLKENLERAERNLAEGGGEERFYKLFQDSTFEGSRAAAKKMKKYAKR